MWLTLQPGPVVLEQAPGHSAAWNRTYQLTQILDHDAEAVKAALITLAGESGIGHGFSRRDKEVFTNLAARVMKDESLTDADLAPCRERNDARFPELPRLSR